MKMKTKTQKLCLRPLCDGIICCNSFLLRPGKLKESSRERQRKRGMVNVVVESESEGGGRGGVEVGCMGLESGGWLLDVFGVVLGWTGVIGR